MLEAAADLGQPALLTSAEEQASFQCFVRLFREWIRLEHGMPGSPDLRSEQTRLLLYAIIGGTTLQRSLDLLVRFRRTVYGDRGGTAIRDLGSSIALIVEDPLRPGPEGLIGEIWPLSFILCQLEFLAGSALPGVSGKVRNAPLLPDSTARLLFHEPLEYSAAELALIIPKVQLARPVVPSADDIPAFLQKLMPTAVSARPHNIRMSSVVSGMIRSDKLRKQGLPDDFGPIAARLGLSEATLRRRLRSEDTTFREIKEGVTDELAKDWLVNTRDSIEAIAERLGFSDSFAFRRAFRRSNGVAPLAFRRLLLTQERH